MPVNDYYQVLGIDANADPVLVKEAYRKLAFAHHPDRNAQNPEAAERMKAVNEAYAVLSNPQKRGEYDRMRRQYGAAAHSRFRSGYTDQEIFRGSDIEQIFEEVARSFGLRGFDEIFKELHGMQGRRFTVDGQRLSGRGFVLFGAFGPKRGSGRATLMGKAASSLLGKMGFPQLPVKGEDLQETIELSPTLARVGGPFAYFHRKKGRKLVVKVPPGVREGQKIRLTAMGKEGKRGAPPGDLYLKVRIRRPLLSKIKRLFGASE